MEIEDKGREEGKKQVQVSPQPLANNADLERSSSPPFYFWNIVCVKICDN